MLSSALNSLVYFINYLNSHSGAFNFLATIVLTTITARYVMLTASLVHEARITREIQTAPKVSVYIQQRDDEISWMDLVVKNIGHGYAYNVRFNVSPDFEMTNNHYLSGVGFIAKGIASFAPNQTFQFFFTSMLESFDKKSQTQIRVNVVYDDIYRKTHEDSYILDFGQFVNMSSVGKPPLQTIADGVESISRDVSSFKRGWSSLNVTSKKTRTAPSRSNYRRFPPL